MKKYLFFLVNISFWAYSMDNSKQQMEEIAKSKNVVNVFDVNSNFGFLALGLSTGHIQLYNTFDKKLLGTLKSFSGIKAARFGIDDPCLLVTGEDRGKLSLWDSLKQKLISIISLHKNAVIQAIDFNDDESVIASGSTNKTVKLLDRKSNQQIGSVVLNAPVQAIKFFSNKKLLVGTKNGLFTYDYKKSFEKPIKTYKGPCDVISVDSYGKVLSYADKKNGVVGVINDSKYDTFKPFKKPMDVSFNSLGTVLAVAGGNTDKLKLLDVVRRCEMHTIYIGAFVNSAKWGKDNKELYVMSNYNRITRYPINKTVLSHKKS